MRMKMACDACEQMEVSDACYAIKKEKFFLKPLDLILSI